jgi:signal transduction histidine kinase
VLGAVAQPLPAVAIAFAVLRYRLWDIDVVLSRTLVYGALWLGLSVLLLVPALVSGYLVGGPAALSAVGAALLVTLAFQPLQRRLQGVVDARVHGRRRRGLQELARVGEMLRGAAHVEEAGPRVAGTLREALQVPWAAVWVHVRTGPAEGLRPVGSAGVEALPVRLPESAAAALRAHPRPRLAVDLPEALRELVPGPAGAITPLVVGEELVGLLACGERAREPLQAADLEPLDRFAGECALGLRGLRLAAELRARLDEIEHQAAELRSSRQRLVRAQDDERRRIERDLHDGVQQQLVGLAARLRRLAPRVDPAHRADCERLADDAEDTVFALQDLARGIFPAVLADQGLAAALRAHAGRTPLPVHVEIEPRLLGRRVDPEAEAALYFVALEALTNVAKHAPEATTSLVLRTDEAGRRLVLEVHDDGPGLPRSGRREGTGLVNMRDRVAAVGGELGVDSRPGAGTWVRAAVPLSYPVVALRPADADSRR